MKQVDAREFMLGLTTSMLEIATRNLPGVLASHPDAEGLVLFTNMQMDASRFGDQSVVVVGLGCTIESVAACEGRWLGDLPSQRKYPQVWVAAGDMRGFFAPRAA